MQRLLHEYDVLVGERVVRVGVVGENQDLDGLPRTVGHRRGIVRRNRQLVRIHRERHEARGVRRAAAMA